MVHGKGSLLGKMPGDEWQRFANLRLLLTYQMTSPGKKLLFMGSEFGQWREWRKRGNSTGTCCSIPPHAGVQRLARDLNRLYARHAGPARTGFRPASGFSWIDCHDADQSVLSWLRWARDGSFVVVVLNFTPVPRSRLPHRRAGGRALPRNLQQRFAPTTAAATSAIQGRSTACEGEWMNRPANLEITIPPLAAVVLRLE